jgi:alanyl-tRNA synthetase
VPEAVTQLHESRDRLQHDLDSKQRSGIDAAALTLIAKAESVGTAKLIAENVGDGDVAHLRALADKVKAGIPSGVIVLGGVRGGNPSLVIFVTKDLAAHVDADALVKQIAPIIGGRGGGRSDNASAGGKEPARLAEAIEAARSSVRERLNGGRDRN